MARKSAGPPDISGTQGGLLFKNVLKLRGHFMRTGLPLGTRLFALYECIVATFPVCLLMYFQEKQLEMQSSKLSMHNTKKPKTAGMSNFHL